MKQINSLPLTGLLCLALMSSCTKDCDHIINSGISPDEIIRFERMDGIPAFADSFTSILIRVRVNNQTNERHDISLTATTGLINGTALTATQTSNLDGYADFYFTPGQVALPVNFRAKVKDDLYRDTAIQLLPAFPDQVIVTPEKTSAPKNTIIAGTIKLLRYTGYPSKYQTILLTATDATSGASAGQAILNGTYQPGVDLGFTFTPDSAYTGTAVLKAVVTQNGLSQQAGSASVTITP